MDADPYKVSNAPQELPSVRRFGLWPRVLWFGLGFIVSWGIRSIADYRANSARDFTQGLPKELRDGQPQWLKDAKGWNVGRFTIIAAAAPHQASAHVFPTTQLTRRPQVGFEDGNADDRVDTVTITDGRRTFEFVVADGSFQSYNYSPDYLAIDAVSFFDYDLDASFDYRFGPGGRHALMVDSQWHDLIPEGGSKGRVEIKGRSMPAEYVNGAWRIAK